MSQMSAMVEGTYGAFGLLPPSGAAEGGAGLVAATLVLTATTVAAAVLGGYKRVEKIMTALLRRHPASASSSSPSRACSTGRRGRRSAAGWCRRFRRTCRSRARPASARSAFTQVMAIAGQALPPAVMLSYGYLATNAGQTAADIRPGFWRTVTNLGVIWGLFSVVVIVAGATALHAVYTGAGPSYPRRLALLADSEHPGRRPGARPGAARRARLPRAALLLARSHRRGVHHAHLRRA